MRLLLDTNAFLRVLLDEEAVSRRATRAYLEAEVVYCSTVNYWEIALKLSRGGFFDLEVPTDWEVVFPNACDVQGIELLPVNVGHCRGVQDLPFHHRDPFDRMLVAQANREGLAVMSSDTQLDQYGVRRIW
ncbi:MAG: type II toxin-antitoxin system VapC family toxin [Planctomycetota bacterium]|jgi:PIN domain nuclease of toxin-antitoxin system